MADDKSTPRPPRWVRWESLEELRAYYPNCYDLAGIYVLQNERGRTVYVGQSADIKTRLSYHSRTFPFQAIKIRLEKNRYKRMWIERVLLYRLRPRRNAVCPTHMNGDTRYVYKFELGRGR